MNAGFNLDRAVRFIVERGAAGPTHVSASALLEHVAGIDATLRRDRPALRRASRLLGSDVTAALTGFESIAV